VPRAYQNKPKQDNYFRERSIFSTTKASISKIITPANMATTEVTPPRLKPRVFLAQLDKSRDNAYAPIIFYPPPLL
jgi:hypothetical protein